MNNITCAQVLNSEIIIHLQDYERTEFSVVSLHDFIGVEDREESQESLEKIKLTI